MWETLFNITILIHWIITILSFVSILNIILKGSRANYSMAYTGLIFVLQGVFSGCIFTDIQNWILSQYNGGWIENKLILDYVITGNSEMLRVLLAVIGLAFTLPVIQRFIK